MDARRAATVLVLAVILGIVAQLLFFAVPLGINLLLMLAAILVASQFTRAGGARFDPLDAWLPLGALALAAFVAVRSDAVLVALDAMGAISLTILSVAAFGGVSVTRRSAAHVVLLAGDLIAGALAAAAPLIVVVNRIYRPGSAVRRSAGPVAGTLRGLAIALPILLVFGLLFAAADAVFARVVGDAFTVGIDFGEVTGRFSYTIVAGWLCAGLLACVALGTFVTSVPPVDASSAGDTAGHRGWRLGTVETLVVLVAVDLLFAIFAVIQATYLFGGRDTLAASGLTYSEYARRGFFELVTVALLAGILLVVADALVVRRTGWVLAAELALCAMAGVVLTSALLRLMLYQQAYGWTELRFYVLAAIVWLALGIAASVGALVRRRMGWLPHALTVAALGVTLAVNVIGPQSFIAAQNVARALDPSLVPPGGQSGLDGRYLASLGFDAVPAVAEALPRLSRADRENLSFSLALRLRELERDEGSSRWQAWNLARERAREALDEVRGDLPAVEAGGG